MRKPNEYVAAAKAHLRDSLIPDCSEVMRHGERTAKVTRVGSPSAGGEPLMGDEPAENCRVLALAADFPELARGEAVELGRTFRVVLSCTADIAGAGYTVGLSDAFEKCPACYTGTRRESGQVRQIKHPLDVLILETGTADNYADALAPTCATAYTVAIRRDDWPETSEPDPSDQLEVCPQAGCGAATGPVRSITLKVSTVSRHDGWYILKCRSRGGAEW